MRSHFISAFVISAFVIPESKAEGAFLRALRRDFALYSSVAILTERAQKLREKFGWENVRITQLLKTIAKVTTVLKTQPHLHLLKDEPDNRVLECSEAASPDFIVTGDKHLLSLRNFQEVKVIRLSDFLRNL